jgi:3-hydroxyacyl-CoA dehydrogenase/enoyl-CoA hydratase/3-hydroxybutyryl-CoA epimerase
MIRTLPPPPPAPPGSLPSPRGTRAASGNEAATNAPAPRNLRRMVRDDGICVLTLDRPGSSANIFDRRTLAELDAELDLIAGMPGLQGLILTSAKRSIFVAGADLTMLGADAAPDDVRELIDLGQAVMNRLAALPIPTAAAIHGAAVGGGCELCLACDYRVASPDRATRIGLPETQLGILPAWGGSTRLPRLVGLPRALEIILAGKTLAAKPARKCGLVDELAPAEYLVEAAARMVRGGKVRLPRHPLLNHRLVAGAIAARTRSRLLKKTRGHYPAVLKALEVVTKGLSRSLPQSLALEREAMVELARTDACHNLVRVFFLQERAKKLVVTGAGPSAAPNGKKRAFAEPNGTLRQPSVPCPTPPLAIARTAVIGSGVMGAGIAQWLSARQLPVILRDLNTDQVARGMAAITRIYQDGARRHAFTPLEMRQGLDRIFPAPTEVPLRHVDLVIEAAVEKLELKRAIFQRLDESAGDNTLLATNTSALPISELAAGTRRPDRVLGLHFFNPVHRMQLVEIVAARQTSPETLQRALRFVQQIGKLPVIVKDSPGFLVNRILMPYLVEAGNLFEAGASVRDLDEAMLDFGMPMGPMCLLDEVGIDVALHVANTLAAHYRDRMVVPGVLNRMVQTGLLGRKSGRGFYLHAKGKSPVPNPEVATKLPTQHSTLKTLPSALQRRMVLLMINEAARCLEEQIVAEPADVDFAMIMGTGFAPFRGGPLRYADNLGAAALVDAMDSLVKEGALHFAPCRLLRTLAAARGRFYSDK